MKHIKNVKCDNQSIIKYIKLFSSTNNDSYRFIVKCFISGILFLFIGVCAKLLSVIIFSTYLLIFSFFEFFTFIKTIKLKNKYICPDITGLVYIHCILFVILVLIQLCSIKNTYRYKSKVLVTYSNTETDTLDFLTDRKVFNLKGGDLRSLKNDNWHVRVSGVRKFEVLESVKVKYDD